MEKKFLLILLGIIHIITLGREIDFEHGGKRRAYLLDGGRVRISENYKWQGPSKEVVLNGFSSGIKKASVVIEDEDVEDVIFSIKNEENRDTKDLYKGSRVEYAGESYTLLSLAPLIIEKVEDGKVVINPAGEIVIDSLDEREVKNKIRVIGKNPMEELNLSYEYEGIQWKKLYNLNLDSKSLENIVVLKNSTNQNFKNLQLNYGVKESIDLNLEPQVEKKLDLWEKEIKVEKKYIYKISEDSNNPSMELKILGEQLPDKTSVRVIEGRKYIGNMISHEKNGVLNFGGIIDSKIDIVKKNKELRFGEKFSRNSVEVSIKNYKKEDIILEVIYDELPEKWYEMKSELPYEIQKNEIVFQVMVPANSRKKVSFSYIMEKI